jgi:hypothetical protein
VHSQLSASCDQPKVPILPIGATEANPPDWINIGMIPKFNEPQPASAMRPLAKSWNITHRLRRIYGGERIRVVRGRNGRSGDAGAGVVAVHSPLYRGYVTLLGIRLINVQCSVACTCTLLNT